jgi:hypothetical protein
MVWTSLTRGTFSSRTSSAVRRQAEMAGRTAFLAPLMRTRPVSLKSGPPRTTSFSIGPIVREAGAEFNLGGRSRGPQPATPRLDQPQES